MAAALASRPHGVGLGRGGRPLPCVLNGKEAQRGVHQAGDTSQFRDDAE